MTTYKNFPPQEFTKTSTGLKNEPTPAEWENIRKLAGTLQALRDELGIPLVITSGFRSEAVNRAVGGSTTSAHRLGLAADLQSQGVSSTELHKRLLGALQRLQLPFDQLILEFPTEERTWVHLGIGPRTRQASLVADRVQGKTRYSLYQPK